MFYNHGCISNAVRPECWGHMPMKSNLINYSIVEFPSEEYLELRKSESLDLSDDFLLMRLKWGYYVIWFQKFIDVCKRSADNSSVSWKFFANRDVIIAD